MPRFAEARLGSKKKIVHASEQQTDRIQLERWFFLRVRAQLAADKLIFFDESGINLSMARAYGRGPRGERVVGYVPKNWGESVTLIAGIRLGGVVAPMMLDGSMTGDVLEAYFAQFVVRELKPGDIVVWDNLAAHKRSAVRQLIESAGAELLFLPAYSPDLNPIELAWSKLKTVLRARAARTPDELELAVAEAFSSINADDIQHWMAHCGYPQLNGKLL